MRHNYVVHSLLAATLCFAASNAGAQSSGFGKFLHKVNKGLSNVNQALSGGGLTGARSVSTGIKPQSMAASAGGAETTGPEVEFVQGITNERVALFNEALPVIDKTVGIISCITYHSLPSSTAIAGNDRQWRGLEPYVDNERPLNSGQLYGTPMAQMTYHDEHLCLAVGGVRVDVRAANAVYVRIKYLALDSRETTGYGYTYRKNYKGVWKLSGFRVAR